MGYACAGLLADEHFFDLVVVESRSVLAVDEQENVAWEHLAEQQALLVDASDRMAVRARRWRARAQAKPARRRRDS